MQKQISWEVQKIFERNDLGDWFKEVEKGLSLAADAGVAAPRTNAASIGQQMASRHEAAIEAIQSLANKRENDIQERGNHPNSKSVWSECQGGNEKTRNQVV